VAYAELVSAGLKQDMFLVVHEDMVLFGEGYRLGGYKGSAIS